IYIYSLSLHDALPILLDIVFAATAISVFLRGWIRRTNLIWFAGVVVYTAIGATLAVVLRGANLYDFLLAYKFCWYVALLFLASRSEEHTSELQSRENL